MDLGDKKHQVCILDKTGKIIAEEEVAGTRAAMTSFFKRYRGAVVAMETGRIPDGSARSRKRRDWKCWSGTHGN